MKMHIVIHAGFERAAYFDDWANKQAVTVSYTHLHQGQTLPCVSDFDVLVCMGGPQSPLERARYPYLSDEITLIKHATHAQKPIVGVCLGAQLIAESFGARTEKSPHKEVGFYPIRLTDDGVHDALFKDFPREFSVGHWHNDMPGLPDNAKLLASSAGCPRQIIRFAPNIYGFQCHMELDARTLKGLIRYCPEDLTPGRYIQTAEAMRQTPLAPIQARLNQFLSGLLLT